VCDKDVTGQLMDGAFPSEDFDRSYVCSKMQSIYVGPVNGSDTLLSIKTVAVKFEAFRNSTTSVFSAAGMCVFTVLIILLSRLFYFMTFIHMIFMIIHHYL